MDNKQLYKGVFWVIDKNNPNDGYFFRIPCDINGEKNGEVEYKLNSKNGKSYNHKRLWDTLPKEKQLGVEYNYYPRGRVEVKDGKGIVYLNPNLNVENVLNLIKQEFGLDNKLITEFKVVCDYSEHYKCYLDKI